MDRSSGAAPPRRPGGGGGGDTPSELLRVRVETAGSGKSLVSLEGELDLSTIPIAEHRLMEQLRSHSGVILDLTGLSFIDSSGIGLLIQAHRATRPSGAMCTVIAAGSQVERVFRLAGIDQALPLFLDRARAMKALNGGDELAAAEGS